MKKIFLLILIAIYNFLPELNAAVFKEDQVVDIVVKNNQEIASYVHKYKGEIEFARSSWFLPNPMIGIEYMGVNDNGLNLSSAMSKNIEISQKIPFPAKYPFMIGAAQENAEIIKYNLEFIRRQVGIKAYSLYAKLFRLQNEINITKDLSDSLKQLSKISSAGYGRDIKTNDASFIDLEFAETENELISLKQEFEMSANEIFNLSNGEISIKIEDDLEKPEIIELYEDFEKLKSYALDNAPEILMAKAMVKMAENMKNRAYLEYIPDINVKFKKEIEPNSNNYSIMFEAEVPVFLFTNQNSEIGKRVNEYEAALRYYEETKNKIFTELKMCFENIKMNLRAINLYSDILLPKAKVTFEAAVVEYRSGKGEFMKVLEAQRTLLNTKKKYYLSVEEYVKYYRTLLSCCATSFFELNKGGN